MNRRPRDWRFPVAWLFYLVIGFEILYMISPFALYYYATYGIGFRDDGIRRAYRMAAICGTRVLCGYAVCVLLACTQRGGRLC